MHGCLFPWPRVQGGSGPWISPPLGIWSRRVRCVEKLALGSGTELLGTAGFMGRHEYQR